ncbi:hypothetical protein ABMA27_005205 [Loxostege sticticalis]|uniref:TIL domain-containing protein n=1 Tax=Loxostege sticticalis TaxID=481309 RepID=A0ABR3HM42_LOXSC
MPEISMGADQYSPTIEDCATDEEFYSCGWCEPTCSNPEPVCPHKVCTRGCLCRPPLLRHRSGHCVEAKDCLGQKCPPNEEYVCRYGCEATCAMRVCVLRPRRCELACHCRRGLLRSRAGDCVTPDRCY